MAEESECRRVVRRVRKPLRAHLLICSFFRFVDVCRDAGKSRKYPVCVVLVLKIRFEIRFGKYNVIFFSNRKIYTGYWI